jgi:uncharacterized membrane protein YeiH
MTAFQAIDYAGVAVFALTGALVAARLRHDIVTFVFFATVTGIGGGTLRDLLIGAPVFWISDQGYLLVCAVASLLVWIVGEPKWHGLLLDWLDAVGISAYAMLGAAKALQLHEPSLVAVAMGVITATFGGVLRDLFGGQPSVFLRREIYVTAALASAVVFVIAREFGIAGTLAGIAAFLAGFALRAGAILFGWSLPAHSRDTGNRP